MAISSTSSSVNDVSIGYLWAFTFFLETLSRSIVLFFSASNGSNAFGIYVSMPVSLPTTYSMDISCASIYTSSVCTCSIAPLGAFFVHGGPCIEPCYDFLFFLLFFYVGLLPPSWPCVKLFFWLVLFVLVYYAGIVLSWLLGCPPNTIFGIISTFHSLDHFWTSIWMSCIVTQYFNCNHSLVRSLFACNHILWRDA
jgi:hypothetical protein